MNTEYNEIEVKCMENLNKDNIIKTPREKYWNRMIDNKYLLIVEKKYLFHQIRREHIFRMVLGVLSSSAVAAWAIWQKFPLLWAFMVAVCQVLSVIYDSMPYKTRIKELEKQEYELELIYNRMEKDWYSIDDMEDTEILNLYYNYVSEWSKAQYNYDSSDDPTANEKIAAEAETETEAYFEEF